MTATATRLQFGCREILDALESAIRPLDESASSMTLNDRLLDLLIDELLPEDDAARLYGVDPWLLMLDVTTSEAYELTCIIDDCDQAGHAWWGILDQLSARHDAELVAA